MRYFIAALIIVPILVLFSIVWLDRHVPKRIEVEHIQLNDNEICFNATSDGENISVEIYSFFNDTKEVRTFDSHLNVIRRVRILDGRVKILDGKLIK